MAAKADNAEVGASEELEETLAVLLPYLGSVIPPILMGAPEPLSIALTADSTVENVLKPFITDSNSTILVVHKHVPIESGKRNEEKQSFTVELSATATPGTGSTSVAFLKTVPKLLAHSPMSSQ